MNIAFSTRWMPCCDNSPCAAVIDARSMGGDNCFDKATDESTVADVADPPAKVASHDAWGQRFCIGGG